MRRRPHGQRDLAVILFEGAEDAVRSAMQLPESEQRDAWSRASAALSRAQRQAIRAMQEVEDLTGKRGSP